jgi:hypothetical protein
VSNDAILDEDYSAQIGKQPSSLWLCASREQTAFGLGALEPIDQIAGDRDQVKVES